MFFVLFSFSFCYEYTLNAVSKTGQTYSLAKFSIDMTSKSVRPEILPTETFKSSDIQYLEIPLKDGGVLRTPSVGALQDLRITLYVNSENEPTSFVISHSRKRAERLVSVTISKPIALGLPQVPPKPENKNQGGGGSFLSSMLPMIILFCLCQNFAASKMQGAAGGGGK